MSAAQDEARMQNARETVDYNNKPFIALYDLSQLLQTGLDKNTLSICVGMIENGANPDTLAAVIKELRREAEALKAQREEV